METLRISHAQALEENIEAGILMETTFDIDDFLEKREGWTDRKSYPLEKLELFCPECKKWYPCKDWKEGEMYCEICGSHSALFCPMYGIKDKDCTFGSDMIYGPRIKWRKKDPILRFGIDGKIKDPAEPWTEDEVKSHLNCFNHLDTKIKKEG